MTICSTLCYVKKNGKTLMMERAGNKGELHEGKWNGLGGKMEPGETPEDCVVREVREESGLKIWKTILKGIMTFPGFDGENDWVVFLFVTNQFSGKVRNSDEGKLYWIPDHKILGLPLWEGDKHFLKWMKKKKFFSAKFIYKNRKLKKHSAVFY